MSDEKQTSSIDREKKTKAPRFLRNFAMGLGAGFLFFFWALPEIGHRILIKDDYYGLAKSKVFTSSEINCENHETDSREGKFLGLYPYRATIIKGCIFNPKLQKYEKYSINIDARKPGTFIREFFEFMPEMKVSSYKSIYYKTINLNPPQLMESKNE